MSAKYGRSNAESPTRDRG